MLRLIGRDIRRKHLTDSDPLVVAHPVLVGILKGRPDLIYQHGEVVTPREAVVVGAETVLVPVENAAQPFRDAGYEHSRVFVSGLCVELPLVKQASDAFQMRIKRIESLDSLTGVFFSSGAEPVIHVEKLVAAAVSVAVSHGKVLLFARQNGRFERAVRSGFHRNNIPLSAIDTGDQIPHDLPAVTLIIYLSRREEDSLTARLFNQFDYLVAPPHERTNWALGLGLPLFAVIPTIGPFAPLNLKVLHEHGVAETLEFPDDAHNLGERLEQLRRDGRLAAMAEAGWGRCSIDGFARIAEFLSVRYAD